MLLNMLQAVVAGTASSGFIICMLRIVTKLSWQQPAGTGEEEVRPSASEMHVINI
jgi:hypothetical protein